MTAEVNKEVRKFVYVHFHEFSVPPTLEQLIEHFNKDRNYIISILYSLHEDHLLVIDKKINKIMIANPFAGIPTSFSVKTESNNHYYATCAWDSIAMHITLEEDVEINAYCHYCNANLMLILSNEKIISKTPNDVVIHFQYPVKKWWIDIIDTCYNTMNFFCSDEHLHEWISQNPNKEGYQLNDKQIMDISVLLYQNKMDLNYQRPSPDDLRLSFKKNNLTGDFWEI
ncbi:MAG: hypothetical protein GPJ54_13055 [Candidatus Heimdallarchaeota archaeon]|nr:hypothetical protein [Candidatus Heimdallarchaeota archaeon]